MATTVEQHFKDEISRSKKKRTEHVNNWRKLIDKRRGKDYATATDEGRSRVPIDWSMTNAKAAQLYSQMPQIRLSPTHAQYDNAVPVFGKLVNRLMRTVNLSATVEECVVDCINASGIGACLVRYEALTRPRMVDKMKSWMLPMEQQLRVLMGQEKIPQEKIQEISDSRILIERISPSDLLWKSTFRLSDYDKSPWVGHSGALPWSHAKRKLRLKDEWKDDVVATGERPVEDSLNPDLESSQEDGLVHFDEIFYWRYLFHDDETRFDAIQHVVYVRGRSEPVINEPWKGQKKTADGSYIGACRFPIRVLTLHYVSDEPVPPSDSAMIQPMVAELEESREHMRLQRKHSKPLRWFNSDLVDPSITGDLIRGTWNGMIPVMGDGDRAMGEIARSQLPNENNMFDQTIKADIQEAVGVGPNQSGMYAQTGRTASEAAVVQQAFQTEIAQQRAKVAHFIVGIADVVSGLFALYGIPNPGELEAQVGPDGAKRLQTWDKSIINSKFVFDIRPDSTVRMDPAYVLQQLKETLNIAAQSPFVNPKGLIKRILEQQGEDPAEHMVEPKPKGPEPPSVSFRFSGEDVLNPMNYALLVKTGQAPTKEELEAAAAVIRRVRELMGPSMGLPGETKGVVDNNTGVMNAEKTTPSVDYAPAPEPSGQMNFGAPAPDGGPSLTGPEVPRGPQYPEWEAAPRINQRRDISGG
jgi:hypothetical protein